MAEEVRGLPWSCCGIQSRSGWDNRSGYKSDHMPGSHSSLFKRGKFAVASLSAVRACFIFVVSSVVLEVLLFATAILTAGGISSLSFQEAPR